MTTSARLLVPLLLLLSCPLAAQEIAVGERVRLETWSDLRYEGVLRGVRGDTLLVRSDEGEPRSLPQAEVRALYVRRPESRGQSAWKWAKRGLLAGALVGVGVCLWDVDTCRVESRGGSNLDEGMTFAALWFGSVGGTYAAIGGALFPGTHWVRVLRLPSFGG